MAHPRWSSLHQTMVCWSMSSRQHSNSAVAFRYRQLRQLLELLGFLKSWPYAKLDRFAHVWTCSFSVWTWSGQRQKLGTAAAGRLYQEVQNRHIFPIFRHSQISYAASLTYDYIDMLLYQASFIDVVAGAAVVLYGRYPTLGDNHGTTRADARWPNRFREDGGGKCT